MLRFHGVMVAAGVAAAILSSGAALADSRIFTVKASEPGVTIDQAFRNGKELAVVGRGDGSTLFRIDEPSTIVACANRFDFVTSTGEKVNLAADMCVLNWEVTVDVAAAPAPPAPVAETPPPPADPAALPPATSAEAPDLPAIPPAPAVPEVPDDTDAPPAATADADDAGRLHPGGDGRRRRSLGDDHRPLARRRPGGDHRPRPGHGPVRDRGQRAGHRLPARPRPDAFRRPAGDPGRQPLPQRLAGEGGRGRCGAGLHPPRPAARPALREPA